MPAGKGEETGCCPLERGPRRKLIKAAPVDYTLALPWALAISPQGLNQVLPQLLTFSTPQKEFRVESRNEALCPLVEQAFR